ncbi:hypothetical protein FA13DRAFT_1821105 [Coprinellus micaceus]|uniref:DUF6534 domain-containing protein n=1 Tax=Coprinellus micaceus TaxID=71717 RepID=A0A4Y7SDA0_COPMI|nr:hypothetical protein FA13DRAFT_1821105 [Coprinellus micaceus]
MISTTPTIHNTFGALQIGSLFAIFLFGVITLQAETYYRTYKEDKWWIKVLVGSVLLLELGHTICISYEVYFGTITHYGSPNITVRMPILGLSTSFGAAITLLVQSFFPYHLWKVLPHPYRHTALLCFFLAIFRFAGSIYQSVKAITASTVSQWREENAAVASTILATGAVLDCIIAGVVVWYLVKKKDGMRVGRRMVDRLVHFAIRSGALTSLAAIAVLVTYLLFPHTLIWAGVYAFLAKLYTNSLLSALNERESLRNTMAQDSHISLSPIHYPKSRTSRRGTTDPNPTHGALAISVGRSVQRSIEGRMSNTSVSTPTGPLPKSPVDFEEGSPSQCTNDDDQYSVMFGGGSINSISARSEPRSPMSPCSAYRPTSSPRMIFHQSPPPSASSLLPNRSFRP